MASHFMHTSIIYYRTDHECSTCTHTQMNLRLVVTSYTFHCILLCPYFSTDNAAEGVDYTSTTQQVVFQSSDSIQYVEIPITDDGVFERTEYFYADLAISAGSGSVGAPNTTTVFITEEGENPTTLNLGCWCVDTKRMQIRTFIHKNCDSG